MNKLPNTKVVGEPTELILAVELGSCREPVSFGRPANPRTASVTDVGDGLQHRVGVGVLHAEIPADQGKGAGGVVDHVPLGRIRNIDVGGFTDVPTAPGH